RDHRHADLIDRWHGVQIYRRIERRRRPRNRSLWQIGDNVLRLRHSRRSKLFAFLGPPLDEVHNSVGSRRPFDPDHHVPVLLFRGRRHLLWREKRDGLGWLTDAGAGLHLKPPHPRPDDTTGTYDFSPEAPCLEI